MTQNEGQPQDNQQVIDFDTTLVAGSVKSAMKAVGAKSRDLWQVRIENLRVIPNFNVRVRDDAYEKHVRTIADSMRTEGVYQHKPLAGYVANEGGTEVIYLTDGHSRLEAAQIAIREGAEIECLPVVVSPQGTDLADLTVALVKSNTGKPLTPYETGIVCKRLSKFGWDTKEIADRLSMSEMNVSNLLLLVGAPKEVRDLVQSGELAASTAVQMLRTHGSKAIEHINEGLNRAKAAGSKRVTAKHMPGSAFKSAVKKAAPAMFDALAEVKADPAFAKFRPDLREKLEKLILALEESKAKDDVGDKGAQPADDAPESDAA